MPSVHRDSVTSITFDNKDMLASGSLDGTVKLWHTQSGDLVRALSGGYDVEDISAGGSSHFQAELAFGYFRLHSAVMVF